MARKPANRNERPLEEQVEEALAWLEQKSTQRDRDNMVRFGIDTADKVLGVSMANIQLVAKKLGRSHELAAALWATGCYEARMLTAFVDEPDRVTPAQMDRWCREFDNWGIGDTLCFFLFDRTPHAWAKVEQWTAREEEFIKRTGFALLACLAGHGKSAGDELFLRSLIQLERAATDERNFVKKGVSWALRRLGLRNAVLNAAALALAKRLADSPQPAARWVGRDALREFTKPAVVKRFATGGLKKKRGNA